MADLIDRMAFGEEITGRPKLTNHQFMAYMVLYALGFATRAEVSTAWDLQGEEATQANQLADEIDTQPDAHSKHRYVDRVDALALGLLAGPVVAWNWDIDVFKIMGLGDGRVPIIGAILTGLIMSRGGNLVQDLFDRLNSWKGDNG
jgi:hypothetical protein